MKKVDILLFSNFILTLYKYYINALRFINFILNLKIFIILINKIFKLIKFNNFYYINKLEK